MLERGIFQTKGEVYVKLTIISSWTVQVPTYVDMFAQNVGDSISLPDFLESHLGSFSPHPFPLLNPLCSPCIHTYITLRTLEHIAFPRLFQLVGNTRRSSLPISPFLTLRWGCGSFILPSSQYERLFSMEDPSRPPDQATPDSYRTTAPGFGGDGEQGKQRERPWGRLGLWRE